MIVAVIIVLVVAAGIGFYFLMREEGPTAVKFQFVRKIEVGSGIFSGIIFANNHFYVSFESNQRVYVKEYNENFTATGEQHQLTGDGVSVADHQMIFVDNYFYLVHSVPAAGTLFLKKFDAGFNEVGSTTVVSGASDNEGTNDMFLSHAGGFLYVGTFYIQLPSHGHYIRKYSTELEFVNGFAVTDAPNTIGSSMLFRDSTFIIVSSDRFWDDSSLTVLLYDLNWNFMSSKTISAVSGANERFPMGLLFENGRYFVSYTHQTGDISSPPLGEMPPDYGDLILKAFDSDWNLLGQTKITDDLSANSANRAHLAWADNRIYVSYDTNDFKIVVKEYAIG